jgi:hypothetical protein
MASPSAANAAGQKIVVKTARIAMALAKSIRNGAGHCMLRVAKTSDEKRKGQDSRKIQTPLIIFDATSEKPCPAGLPAVLPIYSLPNSSTRGLRGISPGDSSPCR